MRQMHGFRNLLHQTARQSSEDRVVIIRTRILWIYFATLAAAQADHLEMALVLDTGQHMIAPDRFITEGAHLAIRELESNDRVTVITFASGVKVNLPFSSNPQEISRAIGGAARTSLVWPGKQRLYDAIFVALQQFPETAEAGVKRVVAVITNDVDLGSKHEPSELIRDGKAKGVALWVFLMGDPLWSENWICMKMRYSLLRLGGRGNGF